MIKLSKISKSSKKCCDIVIFIDKTSWFHLVKIARSPKSEARRIKNWKVNSLTSNFKFQSSRHKNVAWNKKLVVVK